MPQKLNTYRVTFSRIGGNHDVGPLTIPQVNEDSAADTLATLIHNYARPHLGSREVEVHVDLKEMRGGILVGFRSGGMFTIEQVGDEPAGSAEPLTEDERHRFYSELTGAGALRFVRHVLAHHPAVFDETAARIEDEKTGGEPR